MNKKKVFGIFIGIAAVGIGLFKALSDGSKEKYSDKWFDSLSDDELDIEREKVRQEYCSAGDDFSAAVKLQRLLWKIDDIIRKRKYDESEEYAYPKHSEHGWHLPSDD